MKSNPAFRPARARAARQRGLTLVETGVATAVVAVAASTAVPALTQLRAHQTVAQLAAAFETDVQHTRSLAVAQGETWRIGFESGTDASCYVIHIGAAGACRCLASKDGQAVCDAGAEALKTMRVEGVAGIVLTANVRSIAFDPLRGTTTPAATVRVAARDGAAVHQVVNIMGRVRSCSPDRSIAGYRAC